MRRRELLTFGGLGALATLLAGCGGGGGGNTVASTPNGNTNTGSGNIGGNGNGNAAPTISQISPTTGSTGGFTATTITGTGFSGSVVTFDGLPATNVVVLSPSTITCLTPPHPAGTVDVKVTNIDAQGVTKTGGFTYSAATTLPTIIGQSAFVLQDNGSGQIVTFNKTGDTVTSATVNGVAAVFADNGTTIDVTVANGIAQGKCTIQLSNGGGASNTVSVAKLGLPTSNPGSTAAFRNVPGAGGVAVSGNTLFVTTTSNVQLFDATNPLAAAGPTVNVSNPAVGDVSPDGKFWVALLPATRGFMSIDTAGNPSAIFATGIDANSLAVESNTRVWVGASNNTTVRQFSNAGASIRDLTLPFAPQAIGFVREANALLAVNSGGVVHAFLLDYATPIDKTVGTAASASVSAVHVVAGRNQLVVANAQGNGPVQAISLVTGAQQWSVGAANGSSVLTDGFVGNGQIYTVSSTGGGRVESAASS